MSILARTSSRCRTPSHFVGAAAIVARGLLGRQRKSVRRAPQVAASDIVWRWESGGGRRGGTGAGSDRARRETPVVPDFTGFWSIANGSRANHLFRLCGPNGPGRNGDDSSAYPGGASRGGLEATPGAGVDRARPRGRNRRPHGRAGRRSAAGSRGPALVPGLRVPVREPLLRGS